MKIFLTGGAGFIGSHVADRLLARGDQVTVIDDFNSYYHPSFKRSNIAGALTHPRYTLLEGDISDRTRIRETISDFKPDMIIHLAARAGVRPSVSDPFLYQRVNVEGTLNLLDAAREFGVKKFTFGSTSSIYGMNAKVPFSENDLPASIVSPYAATKLAGEALCRCYSHLHHLDVAVLRFFSVYGPRGRPDMALYLFTEKILKDTPIPFFGDGSSERDYTYVDDIVQGVVATTNREFGFELFNLGESQVVSLKRLVEVLEKSLRKKAILNRLPEQMGDVPRTFADISKAREKLNYRPQTAIEEGVPKFVDWFLKNRKPESLS